MNTSTSNLTNSQPLNGYFSFCHPQGFLDGRWKNASEEIGPPGKLTGAGNRKVDKVSRTLAYNPPVLRWLMEIARCTTWCEEREDYMEARLTRKKLPGDTDNTKRRTLRTLERLDQLAILETDNHDGTRVKLLKEETSRAHVGSVPHVDGVYPVFFKVNPMNCVQWNTLMDHPEAFHMLWWMHYAHSFNKHTGEKTFGFNVHHRRKDWHPGLTRGQAVRGIQYLATHGLVRSLGEKNRNNQYLLRLEDNFDCARVGSGLGHTIPLLGAQSEPPKGRKVNHQKGAKRTTFNTLETNDLTPVFSEKCRENFGKVGHLGPEKLATYNDRIPRNTGSGMKRNNIEAPPFPSFLPESLELPVESLEVCDPQVSRIIPFTLPDYRTVPSSPVSRVTPDPVVKRPVVRLPAIDPETNTIPWVPGLLTCQDPRLSGFAYPNRSPTGSPEVRGDQLLTFLSRESSLDKTVLAILRSPGVSDLFSRKFNHGTRVLEGYELVSAEFAVRNVFNAVKSWGKLLNKVFSSSREAGEDIPWSRDTLPDPSGLLYTLMNSRDPNLGPGESPRTCLETLLDNAEFDGVSREEQEFRMASGYTLGTSTVERVIGLYSQLSPGAPGFLNRGPEISWMLRGLYSRKYPELNLDPFLSRLDSEFSC